MFYLLVPSLIWAFSFSLIKTQLAGLDIYFISFLRVFLSLLFFLPFLKIKSLNLKLIFTLVTVGAVQFGIMYLFYIKSFNFLNAYEVAFFTITTPFYVTIFNDFLNKKINYKSLILTFLSVLGTAVIIYSGIETSDYWKGFLLVQVSNICFATGQLAYRIINIRNNYKLIDKQIFALLFLGATTVSGLLSFFYTDYNSVFNVSLNQLFVLLYLGIIASGVCFFMWNIGTYKVNITTLSIFNSVKIPLAVLVSLILFKESASALKLFVGLFLIILSIIVSEKQK